MVRDLILTFALLFTVQLLSAQTRIDSDFAFQTDPAKKYSLYIPSGYDANTPHTMMVGLHPLNTSRWDAQSWCDTLIAFAEQNNLILMCPDGGPDGAVDDPIDTAFTTALMDSMSDWYNIDPARVYCMGFSWGGLTTYTYGLRNPDKFCGYMPIGAAINASTITSQLRSNARNKGVYVVHGSNDSPNTRYWPAVNTLPDSGAILNSLLMSGVGHTIDFPNRNAILTTAFEWLDSVCAAGPPLNLDLTAEFQPSIFPNPVAAGKPLQLRWETQLGTAPQIRIWDVKGSLVMNARPDAAREGNLRLAPDLDKGIYIVEVTLGGKRWKQKLVIY